MLLGNQTSNIEYVSYVLSMVFTIFYVEGNSRNSSHVYFYLSLANEYW